MSAVTRRQAANDTEESEIVTMFRDHYLEAVTMAERSAALTATAGWQQLYADAVKARQHRMAEIADGMDALAGEVRKGLPDDDQQRNMADLRKQLIEVREDWEHFDRSTIAPVRQPWVDSCDLIRDALDKAGWAERQAPLVCRGLVEAVKEALADLPVITWNANDGTMTVKMR